MPGRPQAAGRASRPALRGQARHPRAARRRSPGSRRPARHPGPAAPAAAGRGASHRDERRQPATPPQYFADIRLVSSLLNGAWPHSRNLITSPGTAGDLDQYIAGISGTAPRRHSLCDTPPLDADPGAALITAAVRILDSGDLRALGDLLAPARGGASRKSPRGRWIRRYHRAGHNCSDGFRDAIEPLIGIFQRACLRPTWTPGTSPSGHLRSRARP